MDTLTTNERSERMRRIKGKDTKPELKVRRLLHSLGYRFRLHRRDLPGRPDIVLPGRRKVVNVHGCFWHGHECSIGHVPKTRPGFWSAKIVRNQERDAANDDALRLLGWDVLTVWECGLRDPGLATKLANFLGPPGGGPAGRKHALAPPK